MISALFCSGVGGNCEKDLCMRSKDSRTISALLFRCTKGNVKRTFAWGLKTPRRSQPSSVKVNCKMTYGCIPRRSQSTSVQVQEGNCEMTCLRSEDSKAISVYLCSGAGGNCEKGLCLRSKDSDDLIPPHFRFRNWMFAWKSQQSELSPPMFRCGRELWKGPLPEVLGLQDNLSPSLFGCRRELWRGSFLRSKNSKAISTHLCSGSEGNCEKDLRLGSGSKDSQDDLSPSLFRCRRELWKGPLLEVQDLKGNLSPLLFRFRKGTVK